MGASVCPGCGIDVATLAPCTICADGESCCPCVHVEDPPPTWAVIAADGFGVTVDAIGDPETIANRAAPWAQQEADLWPEMGLVYMLIEPDQVAAAREVEGSTAGRAGDGA